MKKFSADDHALMEALLAMQNGHAVPIESLSPFFRRRCLLEKSIARLSARGLIHASAGAKTMRIDCEQVLIVLRQRVPLQVKELFHDVPVQDKSAKSADEKHTGPGGLHPPNVNVHAPFHAPCPMPSMPKSDRLSTGSPHVSCKSVPLERLHEEHEVGELALRTTEEMLVDISRLCGASITTENMDIWRARIELEDAYLVNGIIRQGTLQRRFVKNMAGWMNRCYLNAIRNEKT